MPSAAFGQPTSVFMPVALHQLAEPELVGLDHVALGLLGPDAREEPAQRFPGEHATAEAEQIALQVDCGWSFAVAAHTSAGDASIRASRSSSGP